MLIRVYCVTYVCDCMSAGFVCSLYIFSLGLFFSSSPFYFLESKRTENNITHCASFVVCLYICNFIHTHAQKQCFLCARVIFYQQFLFIFFFLFFYFDKYMEMDVSIVVNSTKKKKKKRQKKQGRQQK